MVAVAYKRWSFTRGSNCKGLTGKVLVFWIGSLLWEVVASIFFFPHPYPLALTVNKSPAVYILYSLCTDSPPLSNDRRSGSSSKFLLRWGLWGGGGSVHRLYFLSPTRARRTLKRKERVCEKTANNCGKKWEIKPLLSGHLY